MIWRLTMYFSGNNQGWSEEFYHRDSQNSAIAIAGYLENAIAKRVQFLGTPFIVHAYRISAYSKNDGTLPDKPVHHFQRRQFKSTHPSLTGSAEPGNVGLQCLFNNVDETKSVYLMMGAPPDDAVDQGGAVNRAAAQLGTDWDNYRDFLISTASGIDNGWAAVGSPVDNQIASYIINGDTHLVLTLTAPHGLAVGMTKYPARIRSFSHGKSALNGQLLVFATAAAQLTSVEKIAAEPGQTGGFVKVYPPVRTYTQFRAGFLQLQTMKHRRGLPFGSIRGRRQGRVRA